MRPHSTAPGTHAQSITMARMVDRTLLLVDGSSYLYRAYHALPDLRGPERRADRRAARRRLDDEAAARAVSGRCHGACIFDDKGRDLPRRSGTPTTRRPERRCPTISAAQIEPIIEAVKLLGWPVLIVPGIEADDAIGTISTAWPPRAASRSSSRPATRIWRSSSTPTSSLINTMSNEKLDVEGVAAKFGVPPERIVDYLDADRRQRRQRSRGREGRPEDGGEVAGRARHARSA